MASTHEILQAARDLIAERKHWTYGAFAMSKYGWAIGPREKKAVCWCALGALRKVDPSDINANKATIELDSAALTIFDGACAAYVNDRLGHEAILQVFDAALAKSSPSPASEG